MESLTSFTISVGTSAALFVVFFTTFRVLAPKRKYDIIFHPAKILSQQEIPKEESWSWKWFWDAWDKTEDEIVTLAGLDAFCYLKFLRVCNEHSLNDVIEDFSNSICYF